MINIHPLLLLICNTQPPIACLFYDKHQLQFAIIGINCLLGCNKRTLFASEHLAFQCGHQHFNLFVAIEIVSQSFIDGFVHPIGRLLVALHIKVAALPHKFNVSIHHFPNFANAQIVIPRVGQHLGLPSRLGKGKQVQCVLKMILCNVCFANIVAIGFVDDNAIGHFHNTSLDSL